MAVATHRPAGQVSTAVRAESDEETPAVDPHGESAATGRPRWVVPAAVGLGVFLTALLVLVGVFGVQALGGAWADLGRGNALDAAEDAATSLTTFDNATAEADTQRFLDTTSTQFAQSFAGDRDGFVKSLHDGRVNMTGTVSDAGIVDYDGNTAHVFVAVRAQVTDVQSPQTQARDYRMELTMVDDGGWKLDRIEFIA
jgi:Mce-associated membrane protein